MPHARPDECLSNFCVAPPDGERVCAELCSEDADCRDGWACLAIANTRPDTVFICVAERKVQCLSCSQDSDCGTGADRCILIGRTQRCARACGDGACAEDSSCVPTEVDGQMSPLCIPDIGSCDPCIDGDGDEYGEGECIAPDCNDNDAEINPAAPELCDEIDNDCDGKEDETFDLMADAQNCGSCGNICAIENAVPTCVDGGCIIESCRDGFHDINPDEPGCEYACFQSNGGVEICDETDNDCDGRVDEQTGMGDDLPDLDGLDTNCDGIDGDITQAIFVSQGGDDTASGDTPQTAVLTLTRAYQQAQTLGKSYILMTRNAHRMDATLALRSNISIYGGYSPDFTARGGRTVLEVESDIAVQAAGLTSCNVAVHHDYQWRW